MRSTTITEVLDGEYREYGMYTIEHRAIPSVVDGLKPTQRKALHAAVRLWRGGGRPVKVFQLTGRMAAECAYHHGDASANATIVGMAQSFKNSMPLLEEVGQFGSLRSPEAGAPRYISTRLSENYALLHADEELLEYREDDGVRIEPRYFLPLVPTVLLNGSSGIAVGFATNVLNRRPSEVVKACLAVLRGGAFREPLPWWRDYSGPVERTEPGRFVARGRWERVNTTTLRITELPPSATHEKFEALLDGLVEDGTIKSYVDDSKGTPDYTVKMSRKVLADMGDDALEKAFRLYERLSENLTCLDERGELVEFGSCEELVRYFVAFRLERYKDRKRVRTERLKDRCAELDAKAAFVRAVVDGRLVVGNRPIADVEADMAGLKLPERSGGYGYLHGMPIRSITAERLAEIQKEAEASRAELKELTRKTPKAMYEADLEELANQLKKRKL